ncbi:MAG TPA: ATPase, T2SS/T4P/T4SS family [Candidatus Xenobia bacterium]|jgi:twitching motility protein PilT
MAIIDSYLAYLVEVEGTDLLLAAGARPLMRLNGQLQVMKRRLVAASDVEYHAQEMLGAERMGRLPELKSIDFIYETTLNGTERRFRGSVYYQRNGLNIILRAIPQKPRTLRELGLPTTIQRLVELRSGLIMVAGPARSGKSATLAAMVELLNQKPLHIITVEDPIEQVHKGREALISQRQIGLHADSFASALEGVLREDPDVIVVGDVRDEATARQLLRAGELGHLVLAGMECASTVRCLERLVDFFDTEQRRGARRLVASAMRAVVALQTVPRADGTGRALASELLMSGPQVVEAIRSGNMSQVVELMRGGQHGMRLMEDDLTGLATSGVISDDEAYSRIEACELARVGGS